MIQRCLQQLAPEDNQFIYDAVTSGMHIIEVATHRHGCCVLQRCIDFASATQKTQVITEIIKNSLPLVQDAFGNYVRFFTHSPPLPSHSHQQNSQVVQYVLDLNMDGVIRSFCEAMRGHFVELSMQKFSSNVVEKVSSPFFFFAKHIFILSLYLPSS